MSPWPTVPLAEILQLQRRWIKLQPTETYREIGIRSFGHGIFHKAPIQGSTLGDKRVLRIEPGDLVFNNVFAWEGAVAVAGPDEAGMIGSHRYITYSVASSRTTAEYLKLFFTTTPGREILLRASPGSAGRNKTLGIDRFITNGIPLPPLDVQQMLVSKVYQLSAKIEQAKLLREEADAGYGALCRSILFYGCDEQALLTPMRDLVRLRPPDVEVRKDESYHFAGVYCFGRGVFVGQKRTGLEFAYLTLTRLRTNDFVYPKLMAWEGALAVVPPECDGLVVSTEFPVFEIDQTRVLPEVLDVYFRSPSVWPKLSGASTGTNVRRRRLNPSDFLNHRMPLPPMETQLRLREVKKGIDEIQRTTSKAKNELDLLLPTFLEKTFRGAQTIREE